jgi:hypothetical protein
MVCFRTLAVELLIKAPRPLPTVTQSTLNTGLHIGADPRFLVWAVKQSSGTLSVKWWELFDDCLNDVEQAAIAIAGWFFKSTGSFAVNNIIQVYI